MFHSAVEAAREVSAEQHLFVRDALREVLRDEAGHASLGVARR